MSLWKLPLLVAGAAGTWLGHTPPQRPANKTEIAKKEGIKRYLGSVALLHSFVWKVSGLVCIWLTHAIEEKSILIFPWQTSVITSTVLGMTSVLHSYLIPPLHAHPPQQDTPPASIVVFILGVAFTLAAGLIREACYRTLGRLFTYEVAIRPQHRLVTSGPYAYVRHPAYTGAFLGIVGTLSLHFGPETWFAAVMLTTFTGKLYAATWCAIEMFVLCGLLARAPREDRLLHEHFGEQWVHYARRVRWRIIPGIF